MKGNSSWVILFACLFLGACSGGGDSSNTESGISVAGKSLDESMEVFQSLRESAYKGKTQEAQITKDNLKELSSNLLYQILMPVFRSGPDRHGPYDTMSASNFSASASVDSAIDRVREDRSKARRAPQDANRLQSQMDETQVVDTTTECEDGGSVRVRGVMDSRDAWVGSVDVIYRECREFGVILNGLAASYINMNDFERYTFFNGIVIKTSSRNARYTGSIRYHSSGTVSNLLVTRLDTEQSFQLIDWEQIGSYFGDEPRNVRGYFYSSEHGYISVNTRSELALDYRSLIARGSLMLTGEDNTSASLTFVYADEVALEIDLNGDSRPDEMIRTEPLPLIADSSAGGSFVDYRAPNYPPVSGSIFFVSTEVDITDSIEFLVSNVFDPEGDELTYRYIWKVDGEELSAYTEAILPPQVAKKNQIVSVYAVIDDGQGNQTTSAEASLVVKDAPPEFFVSNFPEIAQVGESFEFDVNFRDPDEDDELPSSETEVRLVYGPDGMSINDGRVSWIPVRPAFGRAQTFSFGFSAGSSEEVLHKSVNVTDPDERPIIARSGNFSDGKVIGIGAFDDDGNNEILITDGGIIQTLENQGEDYVQDWVYPYALEGSSINKILAHDFNQNGILDILVGSSHSVYLIEDRLSEARKLFDIDENDSLVSIAILEKDNSTELVLVTGHSVRVVDLNGDLIYTRDLYNGGAVQVGNVDSDSYPEIILQNGTVLDAHSYELQFQAPEAFESVMMIDMDDDGVMELVGLVGGPYRYSAHLRLLDLDSKEVVDLLSIDASICSMSSGNTDNDSRDELVLGHCLSKISFYDVSKNQISQAWEHISGSLMSIKNLAVEDFDSDGADEILFKEASWPNDAPFNLLLGEISDQTISGASNIDLVRFSSYRAAGIANISPEQTRSIFMSYEHVHRWGFLFLDEQGEIEILDVYEPQYQIGRNLKAFDFDRDGYSEIFLNRVGGFDAVQLSNFSVKWESSANDFYYESMVNADVNEDGYLDRVISNGLNLLGYDSNNNQLFNLRLPDYPFDISKSDFAVANINGTGWAEILVPLGNFLMVWTKDWSDNYERLFGGGFVDQGCDEVVVADTDSDNSIDVFCVGHVDEYKDGHMVPTSKITRLNSRLEFVNSVDVEGTVTDLMLVNDKSYLVTTTAVSYLSENRDNSRIQSVSAVTGDVIWSSPKLLGQIFPENMHYMMNEAGKVELTFSTNYAMYRVPL